MSSPLGAPVISRYRMPEFEVSGRTSVSEQDIISFDNMFKGFLEAEHERFLMPPLFLLDISKKPVPAEAQKEIKAIPVEDFTVTLVGHPIDLLTIYSCGVHEVTHMRQLSHLEVMRNYADAELAIYSLISVFKATIGRTLDSVLRSSMGQRIEGLAVDSTEFRNLVINMRQSTPYLPFKLDRDKLVLLESVSLLNQLLALEKPEVKTLESYVKTNIRSNINARIMKTLTEDPKKSFYLEAIGLASSLSEILPKSYLTLMLYASHLTGFGAQDLLITANRLAREESKTRALASMEKEVESGGNRLELLFEYNIFDYEDLVRHKEKLLEIIDDALKICRKGKPFDRLNYVRQKINNIKTPSELQFLTDGFSQTIFSQRLAPDQPPTHYLHANGVSYNKEDAMLFSSFFADLVIAVNILKALLDSLETGGNLRKAAEDAIRCPFRKAPQMRCVWKPECDHESVWFDALSGSSK
ncbi:MAG: hypothetical protein ACUVQ0_01625 [Thermoproteota archaeon]